MRDGHTVRAKEGELHWQNLSQVAFADLTTRLLRL
jgi:hypothetical protein